MKSKQLLSLLLAGSMLMSTAVVAQAEENAGETETIVWYVRNSNDCTDKADIENAINEYIEPLIGVKVSIITSNEEPELSLALAAGEEIDLYWTANWAKGYNYINDNSALDLTELLKDYPDLYNSIPENVWTAAQQNGHNYFVPVYKEAASGYTYLYSKDAAEKYGWDLSNVTSFEDLTPFLEEMKQDGAECAFLPYAEAWRTTLLDTYQLYSNLSSMVGIRRSDGKVLNITETEEYQAYINLMYEWNQAGYISQEAVDPTYYGDTANVSDLLQSGNAGFLSWSSTPDAEANASTRYGSPLGILLDSNKYLSLDGTFGSAYMINQQSEKADACLKFLGLLYTDQTVADLICYGIEDTHYTKDADGYVTLIPDSGYASDGVWATCSVMSPSLQVGESADKKQQYADFNENAFVTPEDSFVFDATDVSAEIASVKAAYSEYSKLLDTGFYNPEEYLPKYQDAMKEAGIDTIIEEMQKQYDAYLAEN